MMQSEQIDQLVTALAKAQGEILPASKNAQAHKHKYADLAAIWEVCRSPLSKNGLAVIQTTQHIDSQLMLITTLAHTSGQWIKSHMPIIYAKLDVQAVGSAITYAKRYSLSMIVGVVVDIDDDGEKAMELPKRAQNFPPPGCIKPSQALEVKKILNQCYKDDADNLYAFLRQQNPPIETLDHIPETLFPQFLKMCREDMEAYQAHLQKIIKEAASA